MAANRCFLPVPIPANGEFLDLSVWDTSTNACAQTFSVTFGQNSSTGIWVHSGPDLDAGRPLFDAGNPNGISFLPADPSNPTHCHLKGNMPGAGSWGLFMNPAPTDTCQDGSLKGGLVDASSFDGISIAIGGNAGPPGKMTFNVFSVGTPEDPFREQKLTVDIVVPPVPTTYRYLWSELNATCGRREWFNPATIINVGGAMLQLAGIAYPYDIELGKIGFFRTTK